MLSAELAGAREMARAELAQARGWKFTKRSFTVGALLRGSTGGWYLRKPKQKRVGPVLCRAWRNGTVLRATPYEVEEWIRAKFSRTATWKSRYMHHFVNAVIEETHRYARGIPVLADGAS
jgi:hypothetical protein